MPFALPGQVILGRPGKRRVVGTPISGFTPSDLGAALYDMWDVEDASKLTLVGAAVTAWASSKNGYSAAQAVGAARPVYSATSFNGRPGLTFDGSDDELTYAGVGVFPVGAAACEIWMLVDQPVAPAITTTGIMFSYGGMASTDRRRINRQVVSGVNRASVGVGTGGAEVVPVNAVADFSGRNVLRGIISGTDTVIAVNGASGAATAAVPATGSVRTRLGANTGASAGGFANVVVSLVAVTAPLSTDQATQMLAYLKARGGIA